MALISSCVAVVGTLFVTYVSRVWTRTESRQEMRQRVYSKLMGIGPAYIQAKATQMEAQVTAHWSAAKCAIEKDRPSINENIKLHDQFVVEEREATAQLAAIERDLHEQIGEAAIAFAEDRKLAPLLAILANASIPAPGGGEMGDKDGSVSGESIDQNAKDLRAQIGPTIRERITRPFEKVLEEIGAQLGVDNNAWSADGSLVTADGGR